MPSNAAGVWRPRQTKTGQLGKLGRQKAPRWLKTGEYRQISSWAYLVARSLDHSLSQTSLARKLRCLHRFSDGYHGTERPSCIPFRSYRFPPPSPPALPYLAPHLHTRLSPSHIDNLQSHTSFNADFLSLPTQLTLPIFSSSVATAAQLNHREHGCTPTNPPPGPPELHTAVHLTPIGPYNPLILLLDPNIITTRLCATTTCLPRHIHNTLRLRDRPGVREAAPGRRSFHERSRVLRSHERPHVLRLASRLEVRLTPYNPPPAPLAFPPLSPSTTNP